MNAFANDDEVELLKKSVQQFAKKEIADHYQDWEKQGNIPKEMWKKLGEQGLLLSEIPEKYGGLGTSFIYSATIIEMFSKLHYNSIAANLSVHDIIIAQYIYNYGTEQQKSHYLPKMASGELVGAIAMTEPGAGSDLQGIKSTALYGAEVRSEEHTSELQSRGQLVCRLLLEKKKRRSSEWHQRSSSTRGRW